MQLLAFNKNRTNVIKGGSNPYDDMLSFFWVFRLFTLPLIGVDKWKTAIFMAT